jgi:tripartite-type tricarboxylate transporter receptor subunit TctC
MALSRLFLLLTLIGFTLAQGSHARAETYPARTIRMIVAYPAGGSTDVTARLLAQALGEKLHVSIIVENRSGAGGVIGADYVAKSAADGYTLLYAASPELSLATSTKKSVPYNPVKDFAAISFVGRVPFVLVANKNFPPNNVRELIAYAKEHSDAVSYSSFGSGTSNHLAGELMNLGAGIKMQHVPYRGSAPSLTDVMAGQIQVTFDTITAVLPQIQSGMLKPLAVATPQRLKMLPDVPTMAESGMPGFTGGTWFALLAPAATPPAIVSELAKATSEVLVSPGLQQSFETQGVVIENQNPEAFNQMLVAEIDKWQKLVTQIGLEKQ